MAGASTAGARMQLMMMAHYQRWATRRLIGAIKDVKAHKLTTPLAVESNSHFYRKPLNLSGDSIHGTLSSMFFNEQLWMSRLYPQHEILVNGKPVTVDDIQSCIKSGNRAAFGALFDSKFLNSAQHQIQQQGSNDPARGALEFLLDDANNEWLEVTKVQTEYTLAERLEYKDARNHLIKSTRGQTLLQVFNQGTGDRGQLAAAVAMTGAPCPELELSHFLPVWNEMHLKALKWN
jgi:uncharacterized damage-inducible protein DinB